MVRQKNESLSSVEKVMKINPKAVNERGELLPFTQQYGIYMLARSTSKETETDFSHFVLSFDGAIFGIPELAGKPLVITNTVVKHIIKKHEAPLEIFDCLAKEMQDNVLVFESSERVGRLIFVLKETTLEGSNYLSIVQADISMDTIVVDQIRSVFARTYLDSYLIKSINAGCKFYINERTGNWIRSQGIRDSEGLPALSLRSRQFLSKLYVSKFPNQQINFDFSDCGGVLDGNEVVLDSTGASLQLEKTPQEKICGNCAWSIDEYGTLTISPIPETDGKLAEWDGEVMYRIQDQFGWIEYRDKIESVVVEPGVVAPTSCYGMFFNCDSLTNLDGLANWNTSKVENMGSMFGLCKSLTNLDGLANWNTSKVENMCKLFAHCTSLTNLDALASWDTSGTKDMSCMFDNCISLTNLDGLANWNTSKVEDMRGMFYFCDSLTNLDALAGWDTSKVENMGSMFHSCTSLTNLDALASWDTNKVEDMYKMFYNCKSLTNLDGLAKWDTSRTKDMSCMFDNCISLTNLDGLANWNTSKVEDMRGMFSFCDSLTNLDGLPNWDTSKVENMSGMFSNCKSLTNVDLSGWDMSNVQSAEGMFWRCSNLQSVVGPEELVTKAELPRELWIPNKPKGLADKTLEVADLATEPVDQNLSTENLSRE